MDKGLSLFAIGKHSGSLCGQLHRCSLAAVLLIAFQAQIGLGLTVHEVEVVATLGSFHVNIHCISSVLAHSVEVAVHSAGEVQILGQICLIQSKLVAGANLGVCNELGLVGGVFGLFGLFRLLGLLGGTGVLNNGAGSAGGIFQSEDVQSQVAGLIHAVAGQIAAVNFQVLGIAIVVGNSALDVVAAISSFQDELGVVALFGNILNAVGVAVQELAAIGLEGDGAVGIVDHGQGQGLGLVFGQGQLHLHVAAGGRGVLILGTGGVLVVSHDLDNHLVGSGSLEGGGLELEFQSLGLALGIADHGGQSELDLRLGLLGQVDLLEGSGGAVDDLDSVGSALGHGHGPLNGVGNAVYQDGGHNFKVSGLGRDLVLAGRLILAEQDGLGIGQVADRLFGLHAAGEQAQAQGQQKNDGNNLLHNFAP